LRGAELILRYLLAFAEDRDNVGISDGETNLPSRVIEAKATPSMRS
jgi:hypothetical protein